ncbi:MAG: hypothetical protein Q8K92_22905 [Leadbetterella sp.]|nr:hypothetical protein [Leadbetterella sp.]
MYRFIAFENKVFNKIKLIGQRVFNKKCIAKTKTSNLHIHESGIAKFVVLEGDDSIILVSDPQSEYHSEILLKHCTEDGKFFKCLGGGRIDIKENSIRVYGYSIAYGPPPTDIVDKILNENIRDKKIEMMIGVGY